MLRQGHDPNCADYDGRTALMLCAASGHVSVAEVLLAVNAHVNVQDKLGSR